MKPYDRASPEAHKNPSAAKVITQMSPMLFTRNDGIFMTLAGVAIAVSIVCAKLSMFQIMIEGI